MKPGRDRAVYLPYRRPLATVSYILVGMEPPLNKQSLSSARRAVRGGFRNFSLTRRDFILHHCIRTYLCTRGRTYFLTDLSKGMMKVVHAKRDSSSRYARWRALLIEEINLLARKSGTTRVISIGGKAAEELCRIEKDLRARTHAVIVHYGARDKDTGRAARDDRQGFRTFKVPMLGRTGVLHSAIRTLLELGLPIGMFADRLKLLSRKELDLRERRLAFAYFKTFTSMRRTGHARS